MNSSESIITATFSRKLITAAAIGAAILGATVIVSPDRAWANLLLMSYYLITLGLGGALVLALTNVCGASWNVAFDECPKR